MTRPAGNPLVGWRRLARVVGFGLPSYVLAVGAHLAGGGAVPSWPVTVGLTVMLGVLGAALTVSRRTLGSLLAALLPIQAGLHWLMSFMGGPTAPGALPTACATAVGLSHQHGALLCRPSEAVLGSAAGQMDIPGPTSAVMAMPGPAMIAMHLAATVATAWLLARGEAWLWRTVARLLWTPVAARTPRHPAQRPALSADVGMAARVEPRGPAAPRAPPSGPPAPFFRPAWLSPSG